MNDFDEAITADAEDTDVRDPRVLVIAAAGALLLGGLLWFFVFAPLLGGAEEVAVIPAAAATDPATEPDVVDDVETELIDELPLVTYEVFLDRDPFDPVVPEPVAATAPAVESGEATTDPDETGDGEPIDPDAIPIEGVNPDPTAPAPAPGATPPAGGCTTGEQQIDCNGRTVSLIEIRTDDDGRSVAIIQVDTTIYEVREGETFAGSFRVQAISDEGVLLQYGDDVEPLDVGERVLK